MVGKCWVLLWLPLSLLAAERDPFQPVEDPCRAAQLSQWRYGGAAGDGAVWMGRLQDGSGFFFFFKRHVATGAPG